jgi:hypothetical protein
VSEAIQIFQLFIKDVIQVNNRVCTVGGTICSVSSGGDLKAVGHAELNEVLASPGQLEAATFR